MAELDCSPWTDVQPALATACALRDGHQLHRPIKVYHDCFLLALPVHRPTPFGDHPKKQAKARAPAHRIVVAPGVPSATYAPSASLCTVNSTSPRIMPWDTSRWKGSGVDTAPISYSTCTGRRAVGADGKGGGLRLGCRRRARSRLRTPFRAQLLQYKAAAARPCQDRAGRPNREGGAACSADRLLKSGKLQRPVAVSSSPSRQPAGEERTLCQKRAYSRCSTACSAPPTYRSTGIQYFSASSLTSLQARHVRQVP